MSPGDHAPPAAALPITASAFPPLQRRALARPVRRLLDDELAARYRAVGVAPR
ncbi:hypothetical protein GBF38_009260 [Nibea albiflora]|uniref:Uncharacterized protein n=1 Tax=Nibea albiflora TaxID=240163 RepID=A0ACB7EQG4_NIBAL|nr:hypothetical protein GBF38_009260 [Nibea albiflora]